MLPSDPQAQRLRVLYIAEYFPTPARPNLGIFVERQASHLLPWCEITVVSPTRIVPPLRVWKRMLRPRRLKEEWGRWRREVVSTPPAGRVGELPVHYPRYVSPPKQVFHGLWGFWAYAFARPLLRRLHREQRFDLIHAHYAVPAGVVALLARRWMGVPVVLSVHGTDVTYTVRQHRLSAAIVRWAFRKVDAIMVNSDWTRRQVLRYGGNDATTRIVRLGGDAPAAEPAPASPADEIRLLSVGYLEERKGHAYVLRALRQLRDLGYAPRYTIVGGGPLEASLKALVRELGLEDAVEFAGARPHREVWEYLARCDIFALPSWDEAFGVAYIEALGMGKPAIGCAGEGGPEDLRTLGDCVELVAPRDVASLAAALRRLLDDPGRRERMGAVGREIVERHYTWRRNAADSLAIYQSALNKAGSQP
ncbi:MAG TPA: glycosyltransferase [Herpetosiphonaceae bacterium]|nr:glycosyltransferase [Herpetosiphonaceae bacterium]